MRVYIGLILFFCFCQGKSQSLADLNTQREKTQADIEYVDQLLKKTSSQRSESIHSLDIVNSRLRLRESILSNIKEEIELLSYRIELNETSIMLMENDLEKLIKDYEKAILHAQKSSKSQPDFVYIFSARDLNQGYKRMRYLQQVARYRRKEAELIFSIKTEVERNISRQEEDLEEIISLKEKEEVQKTNLVSERQTQRRMVNRLSSKQKELQQDLRNKRRIAKEIEKEIERVIERERKARELSELSPEEKFVGDSFEKNKGLLPWPVERGVITSKFGVQDHPVFKGTKIDNIGVEISSSNVQIARAVFKGTVVSVFGISGGNMAVIIRHGEYLTVYQNVINVYVKPGDIVETKQSLGEVYRDKDAGNKSVLKFMIYNEKNKKNPEDWLAKKR
ncbi:MAG: peptidoglycan DD-metalloendopeptidase family protein [Bacteroidales bacterium]|nr:peptidoglycan DD-metalloendopeptidase family protein [Bacteroidales bacterium]